MIVFGSRRNAQFVFKCNFTAPGKRDGQKQSTSAFPVRSIASVGQQQSPTQFWYSEAHQIIGRNYPSGSTFSIKVKSPSSTLVNCCYPDTGNGSRPLFIEHHTLNSSINRIHADNTITIIVGKPSRRIGRHRGTVITADLQATVWHQRITCGFFYGYHFIQQRVQSHLCRILHTRSRSHQRQKQQCKQKISHLHINLSIQASNSIFVPFFCAKSSKLV